MRRSFIIVFFFSVLYSVSGQKHPNRHNNAPEYHFGHHVQVTLPPGNYLHFGHPNEIVVAEAKPEP